MKLPLLLSVPHAGLEIPPEVKSICTLGESDIAADGDEGAAEVYRLEEEAAGFVSTAIARAFVDMNRAENDFRKDGVIKTHTCWDIPIYRETPSKDVVKNLIERYHRPYHEKLSELARTGLHLGIDCHTMAAAGPPVSPDAGKKRPALCLGDGGGTISRKWMLLLSDCLESAFGYRPSLNIPFKGGHIIRSHAGELPWVQLEMSRAHFMSSKDKRECLLKALRCFCKTVL